MTSGLETCTSPHSVFLPQTVTASGINDLSPNPSSPALSTTSNSSGGTAKKSEPPKRLRYWLIDMIDSGEIPGLRWENAERTIFRIPWKHAGKNNWKEEDCRIFLEWAKHRGKYKAGDKVDPATWKTRLRCALNKLGDIQEMKHRSNLEGNDPYRVYELKPELDKAHEPEIYPREEWTRECNNYRGNSPGGPDLTEFVASCHQENIRRMVTATRLSPFQDAINGNVGHLPHFGVDRKPTLSEMQHMNGNAFHEPSSNPKFRTPSFELNGHTNFPSGTAHAVPQSRAYGPVPSPGQQLSPQNPIQSQLPYTSEAQNFNMDTDGGFQQGMTFSSPTMEYQMPMQPPQPYEMDLWVRYRGHDVAYHHVNVSTGCRVYYGDADLQQIAVQMHKLPSGIFGSDALCQIGLPDCEPFSVSPKQITLTKHLLNNIKRGLILSYENGCFYTERLCQSRVFIFGPETKEDTPEKLDRNARMKVFDLKKFHGQLQRSVKEGGSKPPEIELKASFGQNWSIKTPIDKNLVTLYMIPRLASYYVHKIREQNKMFESFGSLSGMKSMPDSYDRLVDLSEEKTDDLLTELLQNIDPSTIKPFNELNMQVHAPNGATHQPLRTNGTLPTSQSSCVRGGTFQQNMLNIAPLVMNDVEMT